MFEYTVVKSHSVSDLLQQINVEAEDLPLLSLKCKFDCWDSQSKPVPIPRNYARGASAIGIGATYQSGCSTSGKFR
jgi:hypothetical protein